MAAVGMDAAEDIGRMMFHGEVPRRWLSWRGGADAVEARPIVFQVDRVSNVQIQGQFGLRQRRR
jgi:hypothetical protein